MPQQNIFFSRTPTLKNNATAERSFYKIENGVVYMEIFWSTAKMGFSIRTAKFITLRISSFVASLSLFIYNFILNIFLDISNLLLMKIICIFSFAVRYIRHALFYVYYFIFKK